MLVRLPSVGVCRLTTGIAPDYEPSKLAQFHIGATANTTTRTVDAGAGARATRDESGGGDGGARNRGDGPPDCDYSRLVGASDLSSGTTIAMMLLYIYIANESTVGTCACGHLHICTPIIWCMQQCPQQGVVVDVCMLIYWRVLIALQSNRHGARKAYGIHQAVVSMLTKQQQQLLRRRRRR